MMSVGSATNSSALNGLSAANYLQTTQTNDFARTNQNVSLFPNDAGYITSYTAGGGTNLWSLNGSTTLTNDYFEMVTAGGLNGALSNFAGHVQLTLTSPSLAGKVDTNAALDALRLNDGNALTNLPADARKVSTNAVMDKLTLADGSSLTNLAHDAAKQGTNSVLDKLNLNDGGSLTNLEAANWNVVSLDGSICDHSLTSSTASTAYEYTNGLTVVQTNTIVALVPSSSLSILYLGTNTTNNITYVFPTGTYGTFLQETNGAVSNLDLCVYIEFPYTNRFKHLSKEAVR
jgi:hypothetical protein